MSDSLQPLILCFEQTLSPDENVRKHSELELRKVNTNAGFVGAVLTIVAECPNPAVRQASAIYLKNCVGRYWGTETGSTGYIDENEKAEFRGRLITTIVSASPSTRLQLLNILNQILGTDYPHDWTGFLQQTLTMIQDHNPTSVYAGLVCLLELSRVYRWRSKDRREGLDGIIQATFPTLLRIGEGLSNEDSELAGDMMRIVLKIYKSVIWLELSQTLQEMTSLVAWGQLLLKVIVKPLPVEVMAQDTEMREMHVWTRAKKWAYFSLDRLFQRYGNPTQLTSHDAESYETFAKLFSTNFAPEILRCYMVQIQSWTADNNVNWLSPRSLYFIGTFLCLCVKPKPTWALLKDNVDSLVEHFVFPQICLGKDDLELWENDPQEYVNRHIDIYDDYFSPDVAAVNFLVACCGRKNSNCFMHTLDMINKEVSRYADSQPAQRDPIRKEGVLHMLSSLSHKILHKNCSVRPMMEAFFASHVLPEFNSSYAYLRARACEMMNRFAALDFQNQDNIATAYQGVLKCLMEQELPVSVAAALALQPLLHLDYVHSAMVGSVPSIMNVLLQLTNAIDLDSLSNVMEEFVEEFSNELAPYAVELAAQLRDTFLRVMQEGMENQGKSSDDAFEWDASDDKSLVALGFLNTIGTLILSIENTPATLLRLEETVLPVINYVLQKEVIDLYAETFEIIDSCTFSAKMISPTMWGVFETVHTAFLASGMDFIDDMLPALENFIAFGAKEMSGNTTAQSMIFDIIRAVFSNDRLGCQDRLAGAVIAQHFLLHLKGHIDNYLHPIMGLIMASLSNPEEPKIGSYRHKLTETLVCCVYYSPVGALQFLEATSETAQFFTTWLSSLKDFTRVQDKKLVIITILILLRLPAEQVPASVRPGWSQLAPALLEVFSTLPDAIARRDALQQKLSGDEKDEWGNDEDIDDDDDDYDDEQRDGEDWKDSTLDSTIEDEGCKDAGKEYLDFLGEEASRLSKQLDQNGTNDDESDYWDDKVSDDAFTASPLDNTDPYIVTKAFFTEVHKTNPALYAQLTTGWNAEQEAQFQSIMTIATTQENLLHAE